VSKPTISQDWQEAPALAGVHHVKLPVSDLARSRQWYCSRLGYEVTVEFVEQGKLMGHVLEHPNGGPQLALRLAPVRARAAGLMNRPGRPRETLPRPLDLPRPLQPPAGPRPTAPAIHPARTCRWPRPSGPASRPVPLPARPAHCPARGSPRPARSARPGAWPPRHPAGRRLLRLLRGARRRAGARGRPDRRRWVRAAAPRDGQARRHLPTREPCRREDARGGLVWAEPPHNPRVCGQRGIWRACGVQALGVAAEADRDAQARVEVCPGQVDGHVSSSDMGGAATLAWCGRGASRADTDGAVAHPALREPPGERR
jgi:catechol 2,3-dioxygenase-like lactoylglutathione lyase family enzyme